MAKRGGRGRRTLFIEKTFQIKFLLKVLCVIAVGMAVTGSFIYLFGNYQINRMYSAAHFDLKESWEVYRTAVLWASFVSMTLVAGLAVMFTLYDSHKIGGPLYRFSKNMEQIGSGDLTLHTSLRDGDELKPFVDSMNKMTLGLREKIDAISEARSQVGRASQSGNAAELSSALNALEEKISVFKVV